MKREPEDSDGDMSPPRKKPGLMAKTLDGKRAGLQKAKDLKDELNSIRKKEKEVFSKVRTKIYIRVIPFAWIPQPYFDAKRLFNWRPLRPQFILLAHVH